MSSSIQPLILGSGRAGHAIAESLSLLSVSSPEWNIRPVQWIPRGASLKKFHDEFKNGVLFIANPHGLHARTLLEGVSAGFETIICEKPSCVSLDEARLLRETSGRIAILHVFRQTWGIQTLKELTTLGDLGEVIALEGRYWQASAAERALNPVTGSSSGSNQNWKNDPAIAGPYDAFIDIAVHWMDAACFLMGNPPRRMRTWKSHANGETSHRDTHVQIAAEFSGGTRALASISKTVHGATNHFEMTIVGTKKSATWIFERPDEIILGQGRDRKILTRKKSELGTKHPPHHGAGWLEGYVEICRQVLGEIVTGKPGHFPNLPENLQMMEALFNSEEL